MTFLLNPYVFSGRFLLAGTGAFALTGQDANLTTALVASVGSFTLTGNNATLTGPVSEILLESGDSILLEAGDKILLEV